MLRPKHLILGLVLLLVGGTASAQWTDDPDASQIFVTRFYSVDGYGTQFIEIRGDDGYSATTIQSINDRYFDTIVYGPDELLYACDPNSGEIVRFDPTDEYGPVQEVYNFNEDYALVRPRCGWFTADGGLLVTDADDEAPFASSGVWVFEDIASVPFPDGTPAPVGIPPENIVGAAFLDGGGAITQNANGALLFTDRIGSVLKTPYDTDPVTGGFHPDLTTPIVTGLEFPLGVARLSTGPFFTTDGSWIYGFEKDGTDLCEFQFPQFTTGNAQCTTYPQHLAASANDWVYATAMIECVVYGDNGPMTSYAGALFAVEAVEGVCEPQPIYPEDDFDLPYSGVTLPPTARTIELDYNVEGDGDLVFDFADHVYEVEALGSCDASNTAIQTPPSCVQNLIPTGEGDPDAVPVIYLGEGGFANVYNLRTYSGEGSETCTVTTEGFLHSASAYVELLDNPTLVRCEDAVPDFAALRETRQLRPACEFLDLASFFPFDDGNLPDDGRIASKSNTFSLYFLVDYGLAGENGEATGAFCGFRPPVNNTEPHFNEPNVHLPRRPHHPVQVPRGRDHRCRRKSGDPIYDCQRGPFLREVEALLSVARVEPDFEVIYPLDCVGNHHGCDVQPIFDMPHGGKAPYGLNVRTDDYAPGTYQAVVIATTGEFPVAWTYFEIVD